MMIFFKKKLSKIAILMAFSQVFFFPSTGHGKDFKIAVQKGFYPTLLQLRSKIEDSLRVQVKIVAINHPLIEDHLQKNAEGIDLIIFNDNGISEKLEKKGYLLQGTTTKFVTSEFSFWCPASKVNMRLTIVDTLKNLKDSKIALPSQSTPAFQAFKEYLPHISNDSNVYYVDSNLESWRLASLGRVDCALTFKSLLKENQRDRMRVLPNYFVQMSLAIPSGASELRASQQALKLMTSPIWQAKMRLLGYD